MTLTYLALNVILFIFGLVCLFLGGNSLISGSSRLAKFLGINPLIIGLTVIAFGTSSPELLVSLTAALKGSGDIAIGNIVGSNITNIALILGLNALIKPIRIQGTILKIEVPLLILISVMLTLICINLSVGRAEGLLLFILLPTFIIFSYYNSNYLNSEYDRNNTNGSINVYKQIFYIVIGLAGLIIGADLVVDKAVLFARVMGISELIIGISIIALGTSLPELAASLAAVYKKEHDLLVGNIVGSNIFNIGILGLVSFIKPINIDPNLLKIHLPLMLLLTVLILPFMKTGSIIDRWEGSAFFMLYLVFIFLIFYSIF